MTHGAGPFVIETSQRGLGGGRGRAPPGGPTQRGICTSTALDGMVTHRELPSFRCRWELGFSDDDGDRVANA